MAETVLSVDAVVATPVATKRWSLESDEVCLQELVRRSNVASAWRAGKIRRGVPPEAPRAGCKIQCFHNSLVGFADWALLDVDGRGEWRATVRTQKTKANVALRQFSDEVGFEFRRARRALQRGRVNSTDAPAALFADVWTPWTERGAEACYVELRRRQRRLAAARRAATLAASDGDRRSRACSSAAATTRARPARAPRAELHGRGRLPDARRVAGDVPRRPLRVEPAPRRRLPILRPPRRKNAEPAAADDDSELASSTPAGGKPVARMLDDQQQSLEEAAILGELERLAIGLFAPSPQSAGRRERGRLDAAAADAARAAAAPPGASARRTCATANRAAGARWRDERRPLGRRPLVSADAKHEVHLADAPGTLRSVVADNVEFEVLTEQSPACVRRGNDAAADALLAARVVLEAVFKFHPPLGDRADSTVACLESIDAALFGDDDDSDDDGERPRGASPNEVAVYAVGEPRASQEVAFAKHFCRDERVFLGVDGYALTSFEIALAALGDPSRAPPS
ncbi:vacuolar sorting protein 9 (VPS9) domain containing protein [Aureococcus anophagefferens]|nr:vacuolar sorting protein 9 (VPS9) domain containing protein [Aureococcus anophagefferens]